MNNIKPTTDEKKLIQIWDKVADKYVMEDYLKNDSKVNLWHLNSVILKYFNNKRKQDITLLEVGCGSAINSMTLAQEDGYKVSIADLSPKVIHIAKKMFEDNNVKLDEAYVANAFDLQIAKKYDVVWNAGVIEHFYENDQIKMIKEMAKICKNDSIVIITAPNQLCFPFQLAQFLLKIKGKWPYGYEKDLSPFKLSQLVKKAEVGEIIYSYSYNPISGFMWLPGFRWIIRVFKLDKYNFHKKKSIFGAVSLVAFRKDK